MVAHVEEWCFIFHRRLAVFHQFIFNLFTLYVSYVYWRLVIEWHTARKVPELLQRPQQKRFNCAAMLTKALSGLQRPDKNTIILLSFWHLPTPSSSSSFLLPWKRMESQFHLNSPGIEILATNMLIIMPFYSLCCVKFLFHLCISSKSHHVLSICFISEPVMLPSYVISCCKIVFNMSCNCKL